MKKLLLLSVSLLIAAVSISQKIKVTVTEAQIFNKFGTHDNNQVIESPDEDRGKKTIDCDYVFDFQKMTSTFYSRSAGGIGNTLPIQNVTKKGSLYILEIADHGRYDALFSYPTKIYIDVDAKTMLYTWYDRYLDRSFVQQDHKLTMSFIEI
tara:strand:+ start:4685 stop:5140 length:456 start_codon:yes stop_codon:yes gene_type:complete